MRSIYNYAVIRVVPRVERAEFINAGVILDCQEAGFLDARIELDETRLLALDPLRRLDEVAYLRFASVYRHFRDINEFANELKDLLNPKE